MNAPLLLNEEEKQDTTIQQKYVSVAGTLTVNSTAKPSLDDGIDIDDEDDEKYNNQSDEDSDDAYYNVETLPAKSLKVIKEIISRHYGLLFSTTVFGASIGFIIYLFCSYDIWIFILAFFGFIVGIILDAKTFDSKKRTKLMVDYEPTKEEIEILHKKWNKSEDDAFYIQSDFFTPLKEIYRGSSRVYRKKESGAIVFEKKALKRVEEYYGFEIGGGISSFIGFIASLIPTMSSDLSKNWIGSTLLIMFITVIFGLIGCITEREMRKWNYLPPINVCIIKRDSIALHDISHICCVTFGYHLRPMDISDESFVEKAAIAWFKLVSGVFYIVYSIFKFLCYVFWVNSAFTLWIFVTVSLTLLFYTHITKYDDSLEVAMWCIIATTLLAILCGIFVSPYYRKEIKIGALTIQQLQTARIDEKKQNILFIVFILCIITLFVCSFFVISVAGSIDNLGHTYFHTDLYSFNVWDKMVCKDVRNNSFPFGNILYTVIDKENVDTDIEDESKLCISKNYEFIAISVLLLCILWYVLLGTAFWWNHHDQYQFQFSMEGKKTPRKWTQYSYAYIYRKSETSTWSVFKKCYTIELTDTDGRELQDYLNKVCPWYSKPQFVGIHPYSLDFIQKFDNEIE